MSHSYSESTDDVSTTDPGGTGYYVLGGGALGVAVARQLRDRGHAVTLVDDSVDVADLTVVDAAPTETAALRDAGLSNASTVIVATRSDRRNLLISQLVRSRFDAPRVVVLANADDRIGLFADAGHEAVCTTSAISDAVAEHV